jgi:acyl-CoA synthetase (NDP forming)
VTARSLGEIGNAPDLVLVAVNRDTAMTVVHEAVVCGSRAAIVFASGFAESGRPGALLQRDLARAGRGGCLRILGPNCMGVYAAAASLYASVGLGRPNKGVIGLVSQSGTVGNTAFHLAAALGIGFHSFISVGNQVDISIPELIEELSEDSSCRAVAVYMEGAPNVERLVESIESCSKRKPVVVLCGGRSGYGSAAAALHTSALSRDDLILHDLIVQAGAVPVDTVEQLLLSSDVLTKVPIRPTRRLSIVADGGGAAVLAADASVKAGLKPASVTPETRHRLRTIVPESRAANPLDAGPAVQRDPGVFADCIELLIGDPNVDGVLCMVPIGGFTTIFGEAGESIDRMAAERLAEVVSGSHKPVVIQSAWARDRSTAIDALRRSGVSVVERIEDAINALTAVQQAQSATRHLSLSGSRAINRTAHAHPEVPLPSPAPDQAAVFDWLRAAGFRIPAHASAESASQARAAADKVGYPVVMKALSQELGHRTSVGAVKLGVANQEMVASAYRQLSKFGKRVLIVKQVSPGLELIVAASRTRRFGPLLMLGFGGVLVEEARMVAFRQMPLRAGDARDLLEQTLVARAIRKVVGSRTSVRRDLMGLVVAVEALLLRTKHLMALEMNPVILNSAGICVVDAKVRLAAPRARRRSQTSTSKLGATERMDQRPDAG